MPKKKNPAKALNKLILQFIKFPKTIDQFVKENPWLNEDEGFTKSALAVKRTIQEILLPLNIIMDVASQFDLDKEGED